MIVLFNKGEGISGITFIGMSQINMLIHCGKKLSRIIQKMHVWILDNTHPTINIIKSDEIIACGVLCTYLYGQAKKRTARLFMGPLKDS